MQEEASRHVGEDRTGRASVSPGHHHVQQRPGTINQTSHYPSTVGPFSFVARGTSGWPGANTLDGDRYR